MVNRINEIRSKMRLLFARMKVTGVVALLAFASVRADAAPDRLVSEFREPPASARPWVYWFIMDGNLSREGITADFEAMKQAGIGGMILMEVDVGIPKGNVPFMSPQWQELFAHSVREAERLGLQMTLNAGPGWTGSGGPWVKPEQSMQHLVASATNIAGRARFSGVLPKPQRRRAFFGDGRMPPALEKAKDDFYADEAVLAFPTPSGDERLSGIDEKALYVRAPYSSQPGVKAFLPTQASYPALPSSATIAPESIVDLTSQLKPGGELDWEAPPGNWTILRFGRTSTGANTRPAPAAGVGLECDKFDPKALDAHFEAYVGTLLKKVGARKKNAGWTSLHIDSWEMGSQNWTAGFRNEFTKRRGYDSTHYLPVLAGRAVQNMEVSERFLWDLRQTAQELVIANHAEHLKELGRKHGLGLSIEPYDMNPCADLSLGGVADVPMCEFWLYGFDTAYSVIEAASIAHTRGKRIVAAESFTSSDAERWQAYPGSMKGLGDWAFCAGVNRVVFHRYQHQPSLERRPGMTMGPYGVHWERTQTWWPMADAYHTYLARCQQMLRQGVPMADVCFVAAEGAPQVFRAPKSALRGNPPDHTGYNFDACAPETVVSEMRFHGGQLRLPGGASYRVLVLPNSPTMTPQLLRKLGELVRAGATVIGPPPIKSPSLSGYPGCDREVQELVKTIWGECDGVKVQEHIHGRGRVIWETAADAPVTEKEQYGDFGLVERTLKGMGVSPDFEAQGSVRFTHRRDGRADIYFVANSEDTVVNGSCRFRVQAKVPELLDPMTGESRRLTDFESADGTTMVPLRFEPYQSFFVVFREGARPPADKKSNFERSEFVTELKGPWEVSFDERWGGPGHVMFSALEDWATRSEPGVKFYSGIATYRIQFDLPPETKPKARTYLALGKVKNMARVRLNGKELGVSWCAPWQVEMTGVARPAGNQLEIEVANLWPNRLIRDAGLPEAERLTSTTWNPFAASTPLLESGLLGPVTIRKTAKR